MRKKPVHRRKGKVLEEYRAKRDFRETPEPPGRKGKAAKEAIFVVQLHSARSLHYDFRLQVGATLKSWAVPKGPSQDPTVKRLAIQVEDHPLEYANFEGIIPKGNYGAGQVTIWDHGSWVPDGDPIDGLSAGHISFRLRGKKLKGRWSLTRVRLEASARGAARTKEQWLLRKSSDGASAKRFKLAGRHKSRSSAVRKAGPTKKTLNSIYDLGGLKSLSLYSSQLPPKPQLAKLVQRAPDGKSWIHETKFDGYRILAVRRGESLKLYSRNLTDLTQRFEQTVAALKSFSGTSWIVDGEIVWLANSGLSNFQALQSFSGGNESEIRYFVFDIIEYDGRDLRALTQLQRKRLLQSWLASARPQAKVLNSDFVSGDGAAIFSKACAAGLEGVVSKLVDAPYRSGRVGNWIKTKCRKTSRFIVLGYSVREDPPRTMSALLVGFYLKRKLVYAGRVGSGFSEGDRKSLFDALKKSEIPTSFAEAAPASSKRIHWVTPSLVIEVAYTEFTNSGLLRQPVFLGVRSDSRARKVLAPGDYRSSEQFG